MKFHNSDTPSPSLDSYWEECSRMVYELVTHATSIHIQTNLNNLILLS